LSLNDAASTYYADIPSEEEVFDDYESKVDQVSISIDENMIPKSKRSMQMSYKQPPSMNSTYSLHVDEDPCISINLSSQP
jgi:hypothetical protein